MKVKLLEHTKLSGAVIAGRTCYQSWHLGGEYNEPTDNITDTDMKYLDRLFNKHGHYSVSRHIKYCFQVYGISTKTLLALSRHQVGVDLSVMSSRFCKLDKFGTDITKTGNKVVDALAIKHMEEIMAISGQASAEDLAMLYPQAMQYDLVVSFNFQSLQHFFNMRKGKSSNAHFDIQEFADKLYEALPTLHKPLYKI